MKLNYSVSIREDLNYSVRQAIYRDGIVNVPLLAADVQRRHEVDNVAIEDLEHIVLGYAQLYSAPIEFDRSSSNEIRLPVGSSNGGLLIEIVEGDFEEAA